MKIAFDHQIFGLQAHGGVSRYVCALAEALPALGVGSKVFASLYLNRYLRALPSSQVMGWPVDRYPKALAKKIRRINEGVSAWGMARWHPDLVHETYYAPVRRAPRAVPVVVTVHDMIYELFASDYSPTDRVAMEKQAAVNRANHVICNSECTKRDLIRLLGVSDRKVSVVHLGFDAFRPPSTGWLKPTTFGLAKPYIMYVGRREGYKNFGVLVQALSDSQRLREEYTLVAFGGGPFTKAEMQFQHSLGVGAGQCVQFEGDDVELASLLFSAQVLVYPSRYEGFGLPPLEAMALGCPVISSRASVMPEVLADAALYFDPDAPDQLRDLLHQLMDSPSLRERLIAHGHSHSAQYSWQRCAEQTLAVYERVLGGVAV